MLFKRIRGKGGKMSFYLSRRRNKKDVETSRLRGRKVRFEQSHYFEGKVSMITIMKFYVKYVNRLNSDHFCAIFKNIRFPAHLDVRFD